uniref:NADH-ubiquinone oxidoreductase chain 2 n=1 Tax=Loxopholis parietalis TaxID=302462 RepID=Q5EX48_9SAUR|nr:NADH dehydrogenase subunit 2 [Loxopholis parietalis]
MSPLILCILMTTLAMGTLITLMSNHWLMAWAGLEINMLSIMPLIAKSHHPRATEATTKYFLAQAGASMLMLFSSTMNAWNTNTWDITQLTNPYACTLLTTALCMKMGLAPLHLWLPDTMQGTPLSTSFIIATWQKLAPMGLIIMTHNSHSKLMLLTMASASIFIGGWGGLNQTQLRKLLAYSSIANMGWMVIIVSTTPKLTSMTLILYIMMLTALFSMMISHKTNTIKTISETWTLSPAMMTMLLLILISLGGLPPMTGFLPKWLILNELITETYTTIATLIAMATLLSLFFYLRLFYATTMTISPNATTNEQKWRQTTQNVYMMTLLVPPTLLLLPMLTPVLS